MRKCKGNAFVKNDGKWEPIEFELGYFHQWGQNFEEIYGDVGQYTTAIVELPDGRIVTPTASDIVFLDKIEE